MTLVVFLKAIEGQVISIDFIIP